MGDFFCRKCSVEVVFIAENEHGGAYQFLKMIHYFFFHLFEQHFFELLLAHIHTILISTVDDPHDGVGLGYYATEKESTSS